MSIELFIELMTNGGPWALLAVVTWRLFDREKIHDETNKEARKIAADVAESSSRLSTLIEVLVNRK